MNEVCPTIQVLRMSTAIQTDKDRLLSKVQYYIFRGAENM
jgi:hypothetical protein